MDYCHTCRRHLNGAYSCPGCGTVADRSAASAVADTAQLPRVEVVEVGGGDFEPEPDGPDGPRRRGGRQRTAVYGVGAVVVIGALTMFSLAALSGGSGSGTTPGSGAHDLPPASGTSSGGSASDSSGLFPSTTDGKGHSKSASPSASASPSVKPHTHRAAPPSSATSKPHTPKPTVRPTHRPTPTPTPSASFPKPSPSQTCVLIFCH